MIVFPRSNIAHSGLTEIIIMLIITALFVISRIIERKEKESQTVIQSFYDRTQSIGDAAAS